MAKRPKRQATPAQLEGLARARARSLENRRLRRGGGDGAASVQATSAESAPAPDLRSPDVPHDGPEVVAAPGPQVEPGVSPLEAAPPPEVPPPEVQARFEAARASLGESPNGAAPPPGQAQPPAAVIVDPRLCVGLVELANDVTIRVMASSNGVAMTPEVERLTKLEPSTKAQLEQLAPFAVPYLQELLCKGPLVGALIFGGVAIVAIAGNCGRLKKHMPKRAPGKPKQEGKDGVAAPAAPEAQAAPSTSSSIWGAGGAPQQPSARRW
jgi:hypothetical protein